MTFNFNKLLMVPIIAMIAGITPLAADSGSQAKSQILRFLLPQETRANTSNSTPFSKGNFSIDVNYDKLKVAVTHNKETSTVTFPKDSYSEIDGEFCEEEDLFFDYGAHSFHIDLLQKGSINIDQKLAEINDDLIELQSLFGDDAISWTEGKTKKYGYIDVTFSPGIDFDYDSYDDTDFEDSLDFDLEDKALKKDYEYSGSYSDWDSGSSDYTLQLRIIVTKKNLFTLITFQVGDNRQLHDQFIHSFQVK